MKIELIYNTCTGSDSAEVLRKMKISMIDSLIEEGHAEIKQIDLGDNLVRYELSVFNFSTEKE